MINWTYLSVAMLIIASGGSIAAPLDGPAATSFSAGVHPGGGCAGGIPNGAIMEMGRFYYECRDGTFSPKGCINDNLKHVDVGGTFDRPHYRLRCQKNGDSLNVEPIACLHKGTDHKIDETWDDGSNFYTCKRSGDDLHTVTLGCVDQGKRINLKDKISKDEFVMVCNQTVNEGARLIQIGCVKGGQQYAAGDSFDDGQFWFTCTKIGAETVKAKLAGCVHSGKRIHDGDLYTEGDVSYECTIDSATTGVRPVACIQNDGSNSISRVLGCSWVEGQAPIQYEWTCKYDEQAKTAVKVELRCNYNTGGGALSVIEPGCYRVVDKTTVGCTKQGQNLNLQQFQGSDGEKAASAAGLRAC